ncbi:MAG: carboxylating nicotinate-nucleotide diphosphorylase [Eubacterium sp.]|nr:carboxylating nicotinate-nucleotide diphosphorylase [Eubacterium sp.]
MKINVDEYILNTLKEDITSEDVSTNAVMPEDRQGKAELICKEDGIICGLGIFERTFKLLDETSHFETEVKDGDFVKKGQLIGIIYGDIKAILSGERTGLNYLQRMSGIATITKEYMNELEGYKTVLLDTRKTTPNMRPFEKYAVTVGGATNHRYNLSDGVLLKDNHIGAAGSITKAIQMAKAYAPFVRKIEIETETLEQVKEAVDAGADIIMLDNMDNETMRKAVEMIDGKAETECSGNVTKERLKEIAEIGVDFVSCGALTHSAPIMDISLKNLTPIE